MPACRQCGRENAEGLVFCGYCAAPLAKPAAVSPQTKPISSGPASTQTKPIGISSSPQAKQNDDTVSSPPPASGSPLQPKPFKLEIRQPVFHTASAPPPSDDAKSKSGFELIPWSELSTGQKVGRSIVGVIVLLLLFIVGRGIFGAIGGALKGMVRSAPSAQNSASAPVTASDRRDGIESLCKVFQIYGLPKTDQDAAEAARNAAELFKLAGNQSPERSTYILTTIVQEFRSGKLSQADCAQAGEPIATEQTTTPNNP